ncbi:HTH-type transcriptional activator AllS [Rahnella aceris]|uniref:HTH-type transcriptional activator AllS n=1 Tax=Rahnella sp. (strain Y9602) TaxID=2703885 RepID=UPI003663BDF8
MLDEESIKTFMHVAQTGSFSRAAEMLHKTPATISYRIKMLEDSAGTLLLNRTTRTVSLTPAGQHLLERCRQWLTWLEGVPAELQQINDGIERQLNVVVNNLMYCPETLAALLSCLTQRYPFTQFTFTRQIYMGVWDTLLYEDFQLAIGVTGTESLSNAVNLLPLGEVDWVFVHAPFHPLQHITGVLEEAVLRKYIAINVEDTSRHLNKRVAWLLTGQRQIIVADVATKLACHLKGMGIGFLPRHLCQPYLDSGELIARQIRYPRAPSPLSLAWKKEYTGKALHDIVSLFHQKDPLIQPLLAGLE